METITTDKLTLVGSGYELVIPEDARDKKAKLLAAANAITEIKDNTQAADAREEIARLAKFRNEVEKARTIIKAPVIALGKKIDDSAKEFGDDLLKAENRLKKGVSDFALEVERKRREAEIERKRIEAEAERQRQEAERKKRQEEEAARRAAEETARKEREAEDARMKAQTADDEDAHMDAQIAAARAHDEAQAAKAKAEEDARKAREAEAARAVEAARIDEARKKAAIEASRGVSGVKFKTVFEVEDIAALYAAHPSLVTMAVRTSETNALIARLEAENHGVLPSIPGLKLSRQAVVATR